LAQWLIADAWQHTIKTQHIRKPWSWADTWPVARLRSKHLPRDLYILAGAHGSSLAFGPGHLGATALPGEGASVVGGHRDTHFGFLKKINVGDTFELQNKRGQWLKFIVRHTRIDDVREGYLGIENRGDFLTLVTCYPFDAINPGGPLRFVVTAQQIDG
ncbi:MAG: class GN sortase, partial [Cellvibrionaceae bacterium]|nr:class GN sortase [Cellvibrionaceae bacterium]